MNTLDRGTFVGAGVASVAIANAAAASAQTQDFGKPHPPIVAEGDPAITVVRPQLKTGIPGYAAMPKTITPTTPGVVMTMAIWGIDAQLRDVVRRYAKAGYICIAPDIYARSPAPNGDGNNDIAQFQPASAAMLKNGKQLDDLLAGRDWIRTMAARSKVGITGFCMGGGIVINAVTGNTNYDAASVFYGNVRPGEDSKLPPTAQSYGWTARETTPIMGSYGREDTGILAPQVDAAYTKLQGVKDLKIYDGAPHAFFDDTRSSYRAAQASDAWARTLSWFGYFLKS